MYKDKYENILIYGISHKTSMGAKSLPIKFDKIDEFFKIHDGIRYLILFGCSYCDEICDIIKNFKTKKSDITDSTNHDFARIKIDLYDSLSIENI